MRQTTGFGNAGRNVLTSPGFEDIDFSIAKNTTIKERAALQFRAEAFNLFNHPNFGQPINNLASSIFGQITSTCTTRGDLGPPGTIRRAEISPVLRRLSGIRYPQRGEL